MDLQLRAKRAVISGSTAGIGLAIAQALAREGASVVVNGRESARVELAVAEVRKAAPQAEVLGVAADLGHAEGCAKLVKAVPDARKSAVGHALTPYRGGGQLTPKPARALSTRQSPCNCSGIYRHGWIPPHGSPYVPLKLPALLYPVGSSLFALTPVGSTTAFRTCGFGKNSAYTQRFALSAAEHGQRERVPREQTRAQGWSRAGRAKTSPS
jgi:hypothetical protein